MNIYYGKIKNNFAELTVWVETKTDILLYCGFYENSLRWMNQFYPNATVTESKANPIITQFQEYFYGQRKYFQLSYQLKGSEFKKKVWKIASEIEYGKTKSYQEIAVELGKPSSARAVGNALGKNHLFLVIPCHRVIRNDGKIGGFVGGEKMKRQLLHHEMKV
jgi:methylated-DNA-[protein]-cysteine S-methyltransferase